MLHLIMILLTSLFLWRAPLADLSAVAQNLPDERTVPEVQAVPTSSEADSSERRIDPDDGVDEILEVLETKGGQLNGFTADVTYAKEDELLGRREIRRGKVLYSNAKAKRQFAILFDTVIINRRKENQLRHYVFDGQWLAEVDHANKQFIKRQIVAPGQTLDPLKIGEGPIPLPVGQARADVQRRFEVERIALPSEGPLATLPTKPALTGLRLVPKKNTPEAEDFASVDLFYDLETGLPHGISMVASNGDTKMVRLTNLIANPELDDQQQAMLLIQTPDPAQWAIDIRPWKGE